jgi:hypothetical protein
MIPYLRLLISACRSCRCRAPRHFGVHPPLDPVHVRVQSLHREQALTLPLLSLRTIHHRHQYSIFHTFLHSLIGLLALSILYIAGAATAASYWSSLSWCWKYHACRLLTVLHAFAWVCAVLAFILLLLEFIYAVRMRAWRRPMHGHYEEERRKGWFRG